MKHLLLALSLSLLAVPAWAATPIDETRPLDPRGSVEISNIRGSIEVRVWDRPEVRIGGTLGSGVERLEITGTRDDLEIEVRYPKVSRNAEPTTLVVDVPRQANVEVSGVATRIDVNGVAGRKLEISSVSGDIKAVGAPTEAEIDSVSGNVQLSLNSRDVDVESVSGDINLRGRITGKIDAETVAGRIDIDTRGEQVQQLDAQTVSGDIRLRTGLSANGKLDAESVSGGILVTAPAALSARVTGKTLSGTLQAPDANIVKPRFGPGASFEHRYGNGNAEIKLETFSGNAELRLE